MIESYLQFGRLYNGQLSNHNSRFPEPLSENIKWTSNKVIRVQRQIIKTQKDLITTLKRIINNDEKLINFLKDEIASVRDTGESI